MAEETVDGVINHLLSMAHRAPYPLSNELYDLSTKLPAAIRRQYSRPCAVARQPPFTVKAYNFPLSVTPENMTGFLKYFGVVTECLVVLQQPYLMAEVTFSQHSAAEKLTNAFAEAPGEYRHVRAYWNNDQPSAVQAPAAPPRPPQWSALSRPQIAAPSRTPTTELHFFHDHVHGWSQMQHPSQWAQDLAHWGERMARWGEQQARIVLHQPPTYSYSFSFTLPSVVIGNMNGVLAQASAATTRQHSNTPVPPSSTHTNRRPGNSPLASRKRGRTGDLSTDEATRHPSDDPKRRYSVISASIKSAGATEGTMVDPPRAIKREHENKRIKKELVEDEPIEIEDDVAGEQAIEQDGSKEPPIKKEPDAEKTAEKPQETVKREPDVKDSSEDESAKKEPITMERITRSHIKQESIDLN